MLSDIAWNCANIPTPPGQPCKVIFQTPGVYRFNKPVPGVLLQFLQDFELDGGGSTFLFGRDAIIQPNGGSPPMFFFQNCLRCKFHNFKVDWDWDRWHLASVVTVRAATPRSWTLSFDDYLAVNTSNHYAYQVLTQLDPATGSMGVRDGNEYFLSGAVGSVGMVNATLPPDAAVPDVGDVTVAPDGEDNELVFSLNWDFYPVPVVGTKYLLRHLTYEVHGFYGFRCRHCTWSDITFRGVPGKVFVIGEGSDHLKFERISVVRQPWTGAPSATGRTLRPISSTADGIFVSMTGGYINVTDYEYGWGGDDSLNVHNPTAGKGFEVLAPHKLRITGAPEWRIKFKLKDELAFYMPDFSPTGFFARVTDLSFDGSASYDLTLNRELPPKLVQLASRIVVAPTRPRGNNLLVQRANVHHSRARGMLIQTSDATIVDSTFSHIRLACIAVRSSAWWQEGSGNSRVRIENNTFEACGKQGTTPDSGAVRVDGQGADGNLGATWRLNTDLSVRNNAFYDVSGRLFDLSSAWRAVFEGNAVSPGPKNASQPATPPGAGEPLGPGQSRVAVSKDVVFRNNTYTLRNASWTEPVVVEAGTTSNVAVLGNTVEVLAPDARRAAVQTWPGAGHLDVGALSLEF
ncbi:hypothetical protein DFJ74DRAFT_665722 [Hyaloraphidium curvatum]|nr:hypothetical protein DFJ74DRAFT_665722 [Hyaloraphidium curvatum]